MKMWKKAASVMLASAMVFSLAACGSSGDSGKSGGSSDSDTFKIGGIGPTTGDAAIYGTAVKNGIQLAEMRSTQQAELTESRLNTSLKMIRLIQRNL